MAMVAPMNVPKFQWGRETDMSMKPLTYIVSNLCFQVFVAFLKSMNVPKGRDGNFGQQPPQLEFSAKVLSGAN